MTIESNATTLCVGATLELAASALDGCMSSDAHEWQSSDASVAIVDKDGRVTAVAPGVVSINVNDRRSAPIQLTITTCADAGSD